MNSTAMATVIRCSSLSGYPDCPRRGATRLFWREIIAAGYQLRQVGRGIGAIVGTAVHSGAAAVFGERAKSGKLPPESLALDATVESFQGQFGDQPIEYDGPRGVTHNRAEAEAQSLRMARTYFRTIAPAVDPLIVEERFEAEVAEGIVLSGAPDLVAREPRRVRDLKTGVRLGSHAPQIGAYSLICRSNGLEVDQAAIDWLQRTATNKEQPDPVTEAVPLVTAEVAAASIIQHIVGDLRTFREGDPERRIRPGDSWAFLANPSSVLCGAKWCPAYGGTGPHAFCHEWRPK